MKRPLASKRARNCECAKALAELGHDAAGNVDAAARPERQRQVAGNRSEHRAEHVGRLARARILGSDLRIGDLRRRERRGGHVRELAQRIVEIDEARSRQHALGGDVIEAGAHDVEHGALACVRRRHGDVAALAGNGLRPCGGRHQRADAEPGARADDADRRIADRVAGADLDALVLAQVRDRRRVGVEVVDDVELAQPEAPVAAPRWRRSTGWLVMETLSPVGVAATASTACDGLGPVRVAEIGRDGVGDGRVVVAQQDARLLRLPSGATSAKRAFVAPMSPTRAQSAAAIDDPRALPGRFAK